MKKSLSILLALFMILFTINVPVFAMDLGDIQDMIDSGNTEITLDGHIVEGVSSEEALKNGIALAGEGEKVYIEISDSFEITEPITIPSGVTAELDLNGFTLSHEKACTKSYQMIENNGTLKIQDSSENADGKISFTDTGEGDPNYGWGSYTILNRGTLTVESGTIENLSNHNEGSVKHMYCAIQQSAGTTTINDGKISTPTYRSVRVNKGDLIINGGTFEGQVWLQPNQGNATIKIEGGTFAPRGVDGSSVFLTNVGENYTVSSAQISGGTFTTKIGASDATALAGAITGGTFSADAIAGTNPALLAEGMEFDENGEVVVAPIEAPVTMVDTYEELVAALEAGEDVILTADITATAVDGTDAIIDLGGNTLTLTAGGTNFFGTSTIKNGTIDISGCIANGDCIIGIGDYSNNATLNLENVNIVGDGYSSAYAVLYVYGSSTLNINGGSIVVANDNAAAGGVIKASDAANGKINITGTASDPVELAFTDAKIGILDGTVVMDYVDLDINGGANAINESVLTVKNSTLTIKDCDGRALTLNEGDITIENSILDFSGATEGEIRFKKALTLNVDENSEIKPCTIWTGVEGANVNGTAVTGTEDAPSKVTVINGTTTIVTDKDVAQIGGVYYKSIQEALDAANAGDTIKLLANVEGGITVPADVIFNGNGFTVSGGIIADGNITFAGITKAKDFDVNYSGTIINIGVGASLELTGTDRLVVGHGCTFNIEGDIIDAKTANVAELTPSLIMPGASFTGAGVTFNVKNAYIKTTASYCSTSKYASGTFDFNIENSIWEQFGKLAFEAQSTAATVNFDLKDSVLTTTSHLVFGVSAGEIVIDNSNVNVGTSRQIENRSTMTIKNGSVVNGAVATSSNAINSGTVIVEDATYAVTGQFSGSTVGTGTLIVKKGANVSVGSIADKANIVVDAAGMTAGETINFNANLSNFAGTMEVINNDTLGAEYDEVNKQFVLVVKPVAQIGDVEYTDLETALKALTEGDTLTLLDDITVDYYWDNRYTGAKISVPVTIDGKGKTIKFTNTVYDGGNYMSAFRFENEATVKNLTIDMSEALSGSGTRIRAIANKANLTVDNCKFIGNGSDNNNRAIIYGEAAGDNIGNLVVSITNSTFENWRRGVSDNENGKDIKSVTLTGNTFNDAAVYVSATDTVTFTGNTVTDAYVDIRSYTEGNALNVTATDNTLTENTETKQNYINAGGTVTAQGDFVVPARGTLSSAYTSETTYWGECGGNAKESFGFKFYNDDTYMGYSNLNNVGGIINGNVNVSWHIKLDAQSNTDEYWDMAWEIAPTIDMQPNRVEQWIDGVKVAECAIQPNWSDSIFPVVAAVTDADGKILSYVNNHENATLANALAVEGNIIELLADVSIDKTTNIAKSVTINGNGHKITQSNSFSGNGSNAMFDIMGGATVTFNDVTFDGIKNVAIMRTVSADVVIDNCIITNCEQTVSQGLLRLACGNATITDSQFINNDCTMVVSFGYDAANDTDVLTIDGCLFEGNKCSETAVVYFADGDYGTVTNTKFIDNTVSSAGNAATLYMGWGDGFEVSGCTFKGNVVTTSHATTKRFASAIFCDGCAVNENAFIDNTAIRNGESVSATVAVAAYYGAADVSGNYWNDGTEPVAGEDYTVEFTNQPVDNDSYYKTINEDGTLSDIVVTKLVAEVNGTKYVTLSEAIAAANDGDTVTLLADITGNVSVNKAIVLDGKGYNVTGKLSVTADGATVKNLNVNNSGDTAAVINAKDVLIENCNVTGRNGFRYCYTSGTVTFKDSTIYGDVYGIHFDGKENGNIVIDNCQITGWTSFAGTIEHVALTDTTFNEGNYNYIRFYQSATIDGCTFNEKMGVDVASDVEAEVTMTNSNVINGNVEDLFEIDDIARCEITVNGEELAVDVSVNVAIDGTAIKATAICENANVLIIATYKDKEVVGFEMIDTKVGLNEKTATITADSTEVDTVKAFLWKDFASMAPVCNSAAVTLGE